GLYNLQIEVRDHGQPPLSTSASVCIVLVDGAVGGRGSNFSDTGLDLTLILIIALGCVSFVFLLAMIVLAVRCQKDRKLNLHTCLTSGECCLCCGGSACCRRRSVRGRKQKKLSKSDIMLVHSTNVTSDIEAEGQVPVEESGNPSSYCYQVCMTPESAKTDMMFLQPCSPARSTDAEHTKTCGALVTGYSDQQPDIISTGSMLTNETAKHPRTEMNYLLAAHNPRLGGPDSSTCTDECKALGHSDRCWMPTFLSQDARRGPDYRTNLHVPGMDATLPNTE
ncbi:hypothetical protein NHX12_017990, partial [Muraenolepis orangiensis]